jgi:hypothetical protein
MNDQQHSQTLTHSLLQRIQLMILNSGIPFGYIKENNRNERKDLMMKRQ